MNMDAGMDPSVKLERPDATARRTRWAAASARSTSAGRRRSACRRTSSRSPARIRCAAPASARSAPSSRTADGFQLVCVDPNAAGLAFGDGLLAGSGAGDALRRRFAVHHGARLPAEPVLLAHVPQRHRLPDGRRAASNTRPPR